MRYRRASQQTSQPAALRVFAFRARTSRVLREEEKKTYATRVRAANKRQATRRAAAKGVVRDSRRARVLSKVTHQLARA